MVAYATQSAVDLFMDNTTSGSRPKRIVLPIPCEPGLASRLVLTASCMLLDMVKIELKGKSQSDKYRDSSH